MSDTAADAVARAKAIAARLAGTGAAPALSSGEVAPPISVPAVQAPGGAQADAATAAAAAAAVASALGDASTEAASSAPGAAPPGTTPANTPITKRKRWATDESAAVAASAAPSTGALLPGMAEGADKRHKANGAEAEAANALTTKKIWVETSKNPSFNYVGFIIGPGGSKQKDLVAKAGGTIKIHIRGRGSNNKDSQAVPGAPEEPLHVVVEGDAVGVAKGAALVEALLKEAESMPPSQPQHQPQATNANASASANGPPTPGSAADEKNRLLAEAIAAKAADAVAAAMGGGQDTPSGAAATAPVAAAPTPAAAASPASAAQPPQPVSQYKPAPVAQLIGVGGHAPSPAAATGGAAGIYGPAAGAAAETFEEQIGVPNGVVGYIIGKGGESITNMQRKSGCRVQIQKEHEMQPGTSQRIITLSSSSKESITMCRGIIEGMVQERLRLNGGSIGGMTSGGGSNAASQAAKLKQAIAEGQILLTVQVPDADVGLIIGKGGCSIKSIQDRSGANVQIPPIADADNPMVRTVNVTHPTQEGAELGKQLIEEILRTKLQGRGSMTYGGGMGQYGAGGGMGGQPGSNPGDTSIQIEIPDKDVGMVIGRSGCVIREMQTKTRTRIQIPSHPSPGMSHRVATVSGAPDGCNQVKQMIERIVMEQSSQSVMTGAAFTNSYVQYGQQQGQAYGQQQVYGQQQGQAYGQQQYGQQQQYGAYGAQPAPAPAYGQQQGTQQTAAGGQQKTDYSAEWAAYYAAQAAAGGAPAPATAPAPVAASPAPASATAPAPAPGAQPAADAYYDQFFRYAAYYGEETARKQYGAWAPPPGTPNPYGNAAGAAAQQQPQAAVDPNVVNAARENIKDSSVRNVSNLPAWMTKS